VPTEDKKAFSETDTTSMLELFKDLSGDQAEAYALVLSSSGIWHRITRGERGWDLWVHDANSEKALNAIQQYLDEEQVLEPTDESLPHEYPKTFAGVGASVILLACHVAVTIGHRHEDFVRAYGSSAFHILHGQWYRAVTSLMIHANTLHLAGNMVGIALFGTAVCTTMGWGVGCLMILATGIVGNLANALLFRAGHLSVGASTAVFGAIGILAAHQFSKKFRLRGHRMRAWLPLAGGVALLGMLSSGERVDVTAHLFGFAAGTILGAFHAIFFRTPTPKAYQAGCLVVALSILIVSWMKAFSHG
jgi:rhomboid protease GluP